MKKKEPVSEGHEENVARTPGESQGNVLPLLRGRLLSFSATERKVARYIVAHAQEIAHLSMAKIASACQVSDTTVLRTCRRAGLDGFNELKVAIIKETASTPRVVAQDISESDSCLTIARKIFTEEAQSLYDTLDLLSESKLQTAIELIEKARRILIAGAGQSSTMSQAFSVLLRRLEYPSVAPGDVHLQLAEASMLSMADLCIVISYSGRTRDPVEVMKTAKERGAATMCITGDERSPAALIADLVLVSISHEGTPDPVSSRVSQMAIFHSLYAACAARHLSETVERERRIILSLTGKTYKTRQAGR